MLSYVFVPDPYNQAVYRTIFVFIYARAYAIHIHTHCFIQQYNLIGQSHFSFCANLPVQNEDRMFRINAPKCDVNCWQNILKIIPLFLSYDVYNYVIFI